MSAIEQNGVRDLRATEQPRSGASAVPLFKPNGVIDLLFALAICDLFVGAAIGQSVRAVPFLGLSALLSLLHLKGMFRARAVRMVFSLPLLAFLLVHVGMAFRGGTDNGLVRGLQALGGLAFALPFVLRYSTLSMAGFFKSFAILVGAIGVGTVLWHIAHGHFVVWKYLWDTKTIYSLFPLLLLAWDPKTPSTYNLKNFVVTPLVVVVILLSGERKAYVLLGLFFLFSMNFKSAATYLAPLGLIALPPLIPLIDRSGYVQLQLSTLSGFASGDVVQTLSNQEREAQANFVLYLFKQNPLFGIGTNNYLQTMSKAYGAAQSDLMFHGLSIHGEPLRVSAENGLFGLAIWIILILSSFSMVLFGKRARGSTPKQKKLSLFFLLVLIVYMSFEAFDSTMILAYCLFPYVFMLNLDGGGAPVARAVGRRPKWMGARFGASMAGSSRDARWRTQ
jgi:hypothetical protein